MANFLKESEGKQLEVLISWASIAYALGFVTVMIHTARLGIPVIELIEPIYVWIGLPLALVVFSARWLWMWVVNIFPYEVLCWWRVANKMATCV